MSNLPLRSTLGVPRRSALGVVQRAGTFPDPVPGTADTPCSAMIREICEKPSDCPPLPAPCDTIQVVNPLTTPVCDDPDDPRYPFAGCYSYAITLFGLRIYASKDEFPIFLLDAAGTPIFEIPDSTCARENWRDHFSIVNDNLAVGNFIDLSDPFPGIGPTTDLIGLQHTFYLISKTPISLPPVGTLLGFRCNDIIACPLQSWQSCFNYTAIQNGPLNQYVALIDGIGFNSLDSLLRFSGTGNGGQYDGDHQVFFQGPELLRAVSLLWNGDADGGTWINNNAVFICDVRAPSGTNEGEVQNSTIPAYNGTRSFVDGGGSAGAWRWITDNLWFEGTATGQIVVGGGAPSGIAIVGTGPVVSLDIPAPNFNLSVTGTTSYNGTYQCAASASGGFWTFFDGTLNNVDWVGTETGIWTNIDDPAQTGPILDIQDRGLSGITANFSSVEAERSGTIAGVRSSAKTVIAAGHDGQVGGACYLFSDQAPAPEYDQAKLNIIGVRTDQIDVDRRFIGTDTGRVTIAIPGF